MQGFYPILDWIVISSLMGSILIFLILFAKLVFNNKVSANWHYYIWFLLLLRLIVPFTPESPISIYNLLIHGTEQMTFSHYTPAFSEPGSPLMEAGIYDGISTDINDNPEQLYSGQVQPNVIDSPGPNDGNSFNWKVVLLLVWLAGAALAAGYAIYVNFKLWSQIRHEPQLDNASIIEIVQNCKSVMNVSASIPIVVTNRIHAPALFGTINPKLILPENIIKNLSDKQIKYICLHELAHWKRKDIWLNWITVILQILHWFNPVIWYGFYRMHQDCELACDSLVLSSIEPEQRKEYGHTIIQVLQMRLIPQWIPGAAGMLTGKSHIERRITMIADYQKKSLLFTIVSVIVLAAVGLLGCTNAQNIEEPSSGVQSDTQTKTESETNQILAGAVELEGPGIIVTLSDSDVGNEKGPNYSIIHDTDIILILNHLKDAGAEAISVNDQRLISTSSIDCAGTNILINHNVCTSPFIIKVIGNPEKLENDLLSKGGYIEMLRYLGPEAVIERSENLLIPKYDGEISFEYAKLIREPEQL